MVYLLLHSQETRRTSLLALSRSQRCKFEVGFVEGRARWSHKFVRQNQSGPAFWPIVIWKVCKKICVGTCVEQRVKARVKI